MIFAFGMEACKQYYMVKYVHLPELFLDLEAARNDGTFVKVLSKYTKSLLLISDEQLFLKLNEFESKYLFELIHKRRKKSSTIFCLFGVVALATPDRRLRRNVIFKMRKRILKVRKSKMDTTLLIMANGIGSQFGTRI